MIENLAVYSTYFGTSDNATFNGNHVEQDYPHIFISNNEEVLMYVEKFGWIPNYIKAEITVDPVISAQQAKIPKVIPHLIDVLKPYDYLMYKDDKIQIETSKILFYVNAMKASKNSMALRSHPYFSGNILYEFGESMKQYRYDFQRDKIIKYMMEQMNEGMRLDTQLYATGVILRDMKHPKTKEINEVWYSHVKRCGIQCQISFDFVAQRYNSIGLLQIDL
jgi:hypothetical protein